MGIKRWTARVISVALIASLLAIADATTLPATAEAGSSAISVPTNSNIFGAGLDCGGAGRPTAPIRAVNAIRPRRHSATAEPGATRRRRWRSRAAPPT